MNQQSSYTSFIFNDKIDTSFLHSLYEHDYVYIEEVFATSIEELDLDFEPVEAAYAGKNLLQLKQAIHKIKPSFGFVGLTQVQALCGDFENNCIKAQSINDVTAQYNELLRVIIETKQILREELIKLKAYNRKAI